MDSPKNALVYLFISNVFHVLALCIFSKKQMLHRWKEAIFSCKNSKQFRWNEKQSFLETCQLFLSIHFFLPQPHFDCKNIHPPPDFIAWEMPFLRSSPCLRYHCRSIRKEGSYFHIDFTHLLWFSAGWILRNPSAKINSYINQAYTSIAPLLEGAVLHCHQEKI